MSGMLYKVTIKNGGTYIIRYRPRYAAATVTPFDKASKRPASRQKAEALALQRRFDDIYDLGTPEEITLAEYLSALKVAFVRIELVAFTVLCLLLVALAWCLGGSVGA